MPDEFDLISQYFAPLAGEEGLGLLDDAARINARPGYDLIISKDLLVGGVHFFNDADPVDLATKALGVNVSDLVAKGAKPSVYFLGLTLPGSIDESWFKSFSFGLQLAQKSYNMKLAGGDTTKTDGPIVISVTAIGYVAENTMIRRSGARIDDDIYVTGTLGDAALGLQLVEEGGNQSSYLAARYHRPQARHSIGPKLVGIASAAADISDGLIADLGHICTASSVGASILQKKLPLSPSAEQMLKENSSFHDLIWSGGDDYEILFTAAKEDRLMIEQLGSEMTVPITRIGMIEQEQGVRLVDPVGNLVQVNKVGFKHFT